MTVAVERVRAARDSRRAGIYFWMAVAMAATGFIGFLPTFWMPLAAGRHTSAVISIHGAVMSVWVLFFVFQAWLVQNGRVARHRALGLLGISLATLVVVMGIMAGNDLAHRAALAGAAEAGLAFMIVPFTAVLLFAGFTAAAIVNIQRPEWHRRLMLMGTASMMGAPVARPFAFYLGMGGHLPVPAGMPSPPPPVDGLSPDAWLSLAFIVVPMIYDWRLRGTVHPAYWIGFGLNLALMIALRPLSATPVWMGIARFIQSLAG